MKKTFIKNFSLHDAQVFFRSLGEKNSRATQIFSWLYERNISSFDDITGFSKKLTDVLAERFFLSALECADRKIAKDNSAQKFLFKTHDGYFIESVLLKSGPDDGGRLTICVSSQIGCAMGCSFCATARMGFIRNLETAEITDQICQIRRITNLRNTNVVFMGMGEPFNNYDNVLKAAEIMNYSFGFHLSARKITISTCGILPRIRQFFDENRPYNLAISLNDIDPSLRADTMPVEKVYPMADIIEFIRSVEPANHGGKVTLEYIMRGDNTSRKDAERLKVMSDSANIKINLIPLNPVCDDARLPSSAEIDSFIGYCLELGLPINIRKSLGSEIDGACGQLSGRMHDV